MEHSSFSSSFSSPSSSNSSSSSSSSSSSPSSAVGGDQQTFYEGTLAVVLRHSEREPRTAVLTLHISASHRNAIGPSSSLSGAISFQSQPQQQHPSSSHFSFPQIPSPLPQRILHLRLTDELDPFFLYTLNISEHDFQALKAEQSVLVDFATFPAKVIELVQLSVSSASDSSSTRFTTSLFLQQNEATLKVVETNAFRHLDHLSLQLRAGNDAAIKRYLADRLRDSKSRFETLSIQSTRMEDSLSRKLDSMEREVSELRETKAHLLSALETQAVELKTRQADELEAVRQRSASVLEEQRDRHDRERREVEESNREHVSSLQNRCDDLGAQVKELTARRFELESMQRELLAQVASLTRETRSTSEEVEKLRTENKKLDTAKYELEKQVSQHRVQIAALEQKVIDKDETLKRTVALVDSSNEQKMSLEDAVKQLKENKNILEDKVRLSLLEIARGDEIIQRLKTDLKSSKQRTKQAELSSKQQDALLRQKDLLSERHFDEMAKLKEILNAREDEVSRLKSHVSECASKLQESQDLLKKKELAIQWLNKELSEAQMAAGFRSAFAVSSASQYRPGGSVGAPGGAAASSSLSPPPSSSSNMSHISSNGPSSSSFSSASSSSISPAAVTSHSLLSASSSGHPPSSSSLSSVSHSSLSVAHPPMRPIRSVLVDNLPSSHSAAVEAILARQPPQPFNPASIIAGPSINV